MLNKSIIGKITIAILIVLLMVLIAVTSSVVLKVNTNYLETSALDDQEDTYEYIATNFQYQATSAEVVIDKFEINSNMSDLMNTVYYDELDVYVDYYNTDFDNITENNFEEDIFRRIKIYTSNRSIVYDHNIFEYISSEVEDEVWYDHIDRLNNDHVIYIDDTGTYIIYRMEVPNNIHRFTHIAVYRLDFSFLSDLNISGYKIMLYDFDFDIIEVIYGERNLYNTLEEYKDINQSVNLDYEMILVYNVSPESFDERWSLYVVANNIDVIEEYIIYVIALLSIFFAIGFVFLYRRNLIKKLDKSFHDLTYENIKEIIADNQPNKIDHIVQNMYAKIESLIEENRALDLMNKEKEIQKNEAEIKALLSQINPHYIFNLLNSIHKRALKNNETESARMILLMSQQLRHSLEWREPFVTIKEEIKHIKSYIALQEYYHGRSFEFVFDIDEDLCNQDINDIRMPKLIFQTLIENALKYGVQTSSFKVKLSDLNDRISFTVTNQVAGDIKTIKEKIFSAINQPDSAKSNEGIGLQNMMKRLRYYYGEDYHTDVIVNNKNISITIEIPKEIIKE